MSDHDRPGPAPVPVAVPEAAPVHAPPAPRAALHGTGGGSAAAAVAAFGHYADAPRTLAATNVARRETIPAPVTRRTGVGSGFEVADGGTALEPAGPGATVRWPEAARRNPPARTKREPASPVPVPGGARTLAATNLARRDNFTESVATEDSGAADFEPADDSDASYGPAAVTSVPTS